MPPAIHGSGGHPVGLIYLAVVLAVVLAPVLFARRPSPPEADSGPDDGHGGGPGGGPRGPIGPRGGIPLPDAEQSRARLRDHGGLSGGSPRRRSRVTPCPRTPATPLRR